MEEPKDQTTQQKCGGLQALWNTKGNSIARKVYSGRWVRQTKTNNFKEINKQNGNFGPVVIWLFRQQYCLP